MQVVVFPEPREVRSGNGRLTLDEPVVLLGTEPEPLERHAAEIIVEALSEALARPVALDDAQGLAPPAGTPVRVGAAAGVLDTPADPESYVLVVDADGVRLRGTTPAGTLHAAQTLRQLIEQQGRELAQVTIRDWPQMRYRGLFVECKWGPDRMLLDDWKAVVDTCAAMKLNFLGVGVYGCWVVQYDNRITEFLMLPLPEVPGAATPKTIRYYSPAADDEQAIEYLPEMFKNDFFGELVAYGRSRGVMVRPQFNSLGHNTLIPRLRPEVSARDLDGNPTGYGYCLSAPETERLVCGMYDRVLDTYMLPNGVSSFHLGLDEVWSSIGIDPRDPHREVAPWCQCARCRTRRPEELFLDWMLRLCVHLKERGVKQIAVWNDQLTRHMDLLDADLVNRLKQLGLDDRLVVEWWWYDHQNVFTTIRPELGLKRWVVPMTGYYHWWPYQSYLENIRQMMALGVAQGAEGTESYCTFDTGFDRNYRYQAEWAWNPAAAEDPRAFRVKYARGLFGPRVDEGLAALDLFDRFVEPGPSYTLVRSLMPYRYTYVAADQPYPRSYPRETLAALRARPTESGARLREIADGMAQARRAFESLVDAGDLVRQYAAESHRIEVLAGSFIDLLTIDDLLVSAGADARLRATQLIRGTLARFDTMMADLEATKAHYLLPQMLRELTTLRRYLLGVLALLEGEEPLTDLLVAALAKV